VQQALAFKDSGFAGGSAENNLHKNATKNSIKCIMQKIQQNCVTYGMHICEPSSEQLQMLRMVVEVIVHESCDEIVAVIIVRLKPQIDIDIGTVYTCRHKIFGK